MLRNPLRLLRDLMPPAPLQVGEVTAFEDGVATIQQPGGFTSQARGDVTVGDRVYFRDGVIEGPAPELPEEVIEI
jgi:hypothetical protein